MDLNELHPGQAKIRSEARRFNVVACGRRFGKTTLGIDLVAETALDGYPAGWFAPQYKLLAEAWRDLEALLGPAIRKADRNERRIELITGGTIEAWSFDRNPDAGRSRKYKRVVIDEAAHCRALRETWLKGIMPTLTDFEGDGWFLSSPRGKNDFHTLWLKGVGEGLEYRSWKATSYDNPLLKRSAIESARIELGPQFFGQEYLAEFLDDLEEVLIPGTWLDTAAALLRVPAGPRRLAIDLAEGNGGDPAGILCRDDNGVIAAKVGQWSLEQTATIAALWAERYRVEPRRITYDRGGVGSDFGNRLEAVKLVGCRGYKGGSDGGPHFTNLRTAAAWLLRQRLDPQRFETRSAAGIATPKAPFAIPAELLAGPMRAELEALKWTIDRDRRKALEPKDVMAASLGRSPTFADLMIMSFAFPN